MATTYLEMTQGTPTSTRKCTFSGWFKKGENSPSASQSFFSIGLASDAHYTDFRFGTDDTIRINIESAEGFTILTNRVFRDPAAWYNVVVAIDTEQSVAGDRVKIYINGVQETSLAEDYQPDEDYDIPTLVSGDKFSIGRRVRSGTLYFNGEMSWVQFVDGLQLAPTEFGSVDSTSGIWKIKPAAYATPGNNGFCLKMEDRTNLDLDSSSNAHTFTTTGTLTATYDNPSNNFATFNPLNVPTANLPTYANGNTTVTTQNAGGSYFGGTSSLGMVAGKWYCEFKVSDASVASMCGVMGNSQQQARSGQQTGYSTSGYAYINNGEKKNNASATSYGNSYDTSNVIGVALDLDNLKVYFAKDNTWQDSGDPTSGASGTGAAFTVTAPSSTPGGYYSFSCSDNASGAMVWDVNFGNGYFGTTAVTSAEADGAGIGAFEFAPPTGYYALCTKNIKAYGG